MKYNIKPYSSEQFKEISSWWKDSTGDVPMQDHLLEEGSFVLYLDNTPALCLSVLLTQSKAMSYLFGFIKNPVFKYVDTEEYGSLLWNHCFEYAKLQGHKQILCFSEVPKLQEKYKRFGMIPTVSNLTGFIKVLG